MHLRAFRTSLASGGRQMLNGSVPGTDGPVHQIIKKRVKRLIVLSN